jgi:Hsp70 protein
MNMGITPKYIIGIDFGTTNCTMSYISAKGVDNPIIQFIIPQVIAFGTQGDDFSLPSFLYFPTQEELSKKNSTMEWDPNCEYCLGTFARQRGSEVPTRVVSSAKSWLCHLGIDRRSKILPLTSEEELEKISPLEACSKFLKHLKEAWDSKMPNAPFVEQQILVTVPASFDPSARQLIQEATELVGFPQTILLEEPQAAFYSWLESHQKEWHKQLKIGDCVLVIDIGGGTTDFSLISVEEEKGNLTLKRLAVGEHLLLGGDNIDMSLAYLAKGKFEGQGLIIDDWQFQSLVHTCRQGKEKLLSSDAPTSVDITILGRTSKLIGGMVKTKITREESIKLLVDGFFPMVDPQEHSPTERSVGFQQIGLPFSQDPRISCQLAKFLSMSGESDNQSMNNFVMPTAVLFNGGTLKSEIFRERILALLNDWALKLGKQNVKELPKPDFDFAVSRGAVYYGLVRSGKGIKIKSGTSRSYFIAVEDSMPAIPGMAPNLKAICVVPFGMEEGTELELSQQEFALILGQHATFRFFSHSTPLLSNGTKPEIGTSLKHWKQELRELLPIETRLEKNETDGKSVRIKLKSHVTELGVLELWCMAVDGRKWKLEFDIRDEQAIAVQ